MSKTISFSLSKKSIDKALRELDAYIARLDDKAQQLAYRLSLIGANTASIRFSQATYPQTKYADVTVDPIDNGYEIKAQGKSVCFIEFGAGVYYNGNEPYPIPRPQGVVGIGEFGEGKGKRNAWGFYDENHNVVVTHGTPAAMPMYFASKEMRMAITEIAREVFASD